MTKRHSPYYPVRLLSALLLTGTVGCGTLVLAEDAAVRRIATTDGPAMVVTANPHATDAGEAVLRAGGSAVDAAVAIEAVLSLVEPQSSGLGGGGFMIHYKAADRSIAVYDGRETAPAGAHSDMFLAQDGQLLGYLQAKNSGISIGVPGVVAMLSLAHAEQGRLPWSSLFSAAHSLASDGFDVSPRLRASIKKYDGRLIPRTIEEGPLDAYEYFYTTEGVIRDRIINHEYAATLERIAEDPQAFYHGELAQDIVAAAALEPRAGSLSLADLASYGARKQSPLCVDYRTRLVCGPPPASSWVAVGMALGILQASDFPTNDRLRDWNVFTEAQRLAYVDRDHYVADDSFISVPIAGMLNPDYLKSRAHTISADQATVNAVIGDPWKYEPTDSTASVVGRDTTIDYAGTTHFVVVDGWGDAVSMTASVESIFGSTRMAGGMILNNQLTDFARQPRDAEGLLVANHVAPGKRPRSSMSPTIVLDRDRNFYFAAGSPGGNSIIAYTLKTLVGVLDWQLSPQEAVDLPNVVARGDTVRVEKSRAAPSMLKSMRDFGFSIKESAGENSGLSLVLRHTDGRLEGGVDPRREGTIAEINPLSTTRVDRAEAE